MGVLLASRLYLTQRPSLHLHFVRVTPKRLSGRAVNQFEASFRCHFYYLAWPEAFQLDLYIAIVFNSGVKFVGRVLCVLG